MKILQVTQSFVPSNFGGVRLFYNLSKRLAEKGHKVTVYTTDMDIGPSGLSNTHGTNNVDGITVRYFRNPSNVLASKYRLFLPLGMVLAAKKEISSFDIIHLHNLRTLQHTIVHYYARKHGVPYVL
nr:glycosyltransferase [Chloroflexota bacterium]